MSDEPKKQPVQTLMHGGIKFVLMSIVGFLLSSGAIVGVLVLLNQSKIPYTIYTLAFSASTAVLFIAALAAGPALRRWGWSGLMLGMSLPLGCVALICIVCGGAHPLVR